MDDQIPIYGHSELISIFDKKKIKEWKGGNDSEEPFVT